MSVFGTNAAQSVAGLNQAERAIARDKDKKRETEETKPKELKDSVDLVQSLDAVRNLKGNDQEETREDRQEHDHYRTDTGDAEGAGPRLDLEG